MFQISFYIYILTVQNYCCCITKLNAPYLFKLFEIESGFEPKLVFVPLQDHIFCWRVSNSILFPFDKKLHKIRVEITEMSRICWWVLTHFRYKNVIHELSSCDLRQRICCQIRNHISYISFREFTLCDLSQRICFQIRNHTCYIYKMFVNFLQHHVID